MSPPRIHRVTTLDLVVTRRDWPFALERRGEIDAHFAEARRLHPESWNIWRQTAAVDERGLASGPEFWARVDALGSRRYYAPVDMEGMPD